MHYLDETHISLFLVQVFILLVAAKVLGGLCLYRGIPALAGEIAAGILLGPTILGRLSPALQDALFPRETIQVTMLDTVSWFGVLFLLLATGFEVNVNKVLKQGKAAVSIGVVGVVVPVVIGCLVFFWLPTQTARFQAEHLILVLFLATAASITAIDIVARLMHDMDILKSDLGSTSLSACAVNDVFGWLVFTVVLALAGEATVGAEALAKVFFEIVLFGAFCMTLGSKIVGAITLRIIKSRLPKPGTMLSFIACLGVLCGAVTHWIGIHAILGFFLAGIMVGNTSEVSEHTRETLSQTIHAVFVPLFFAGIGIKVDFLAGGNVLFIVIFTVVAIGGKFMGAWAGARLAHMSKPDAISVGLAFTPGGAMGIVVGILALEMGLLTENTFIAIVFASLLSSLLVGPLLEWSLRRRKAVDVAGFLLCDAGTFEVKGRTRWEVIEELCDKVAECAAHVDRQTLAQAVRQREEVMGTGLEHGVAVPHARLKGLEKPLVAFGLSKQGIQWDARDGRATHFVYLILTPEEDEGIQVQILASIARAMTQPDLPTRLMSAENGAAVSEALKEVLAAGQSA